MHKGLLKIKLATVDQEIEFCWHLSMSIDFNIMIALDRLGINRQLDQDLCKQWTVAVESTFGVMKIVQSVDVHGVGILSNF